MKTGPLRRVKERVTWSRSAELPRCPNPTKAVKIVTRMFHPPLRSSQVVCWSLQPRALTHSNQAAHRCTSSGARGKVARASERHVSWHQSVKGKLYVLGPVTVRQRLHNLRDTCSHQDICYIINRRRLKFRSVEAAQTETKATQWLGLPFNLHNSIFIITFITFKFVLHVSAPFPAIISCDFKLKNHCRVSKCMELTSCSYNLIINYLRAGLHLTFYANYFKSQIVHWRTKNKTGWKTVQSKTK
jgi:hypothetical protein